MQQAFEDQQRRDELAHLQEQNQKVVTGNSSIRKLIKMKATIN